MQQLIGTSSTAEGRAVKNVMKKLKNSRGFTLAETLMTVLILVMVAGVVAGGIPAAVTAYSKAVDAANAQVLISTTVNALRGELTTAKDVHFNSGGDLIYISSSTGSKTKLYTDTEDKEETIMVQDFLTFDESGPQKDAKPRRLVSKSAATKNLQITYESAAWAEGQENEVLAFENLKVTRGDTGPSVAEIEKLYIRCLGMNMAHTVPES